MASLNFIHTFFIKYVVTSAINYNILIGLHVFILFGFGLDNWTKQTSIRPKWSIDNRKKEFIHIKFVVTAIIILVEIVFGCAFASNLLWKLILLVKTLVFIYNFVEQNNPPS